MKHSLKDNIDEENESHFRPKKYLYVLKITCKFKGMQVIKNLTQVHKINFPHWICIRKHGDLNSYQKK